MSNRVLLASYVMLVKELMKTTGNCDIEVEYDPFQFPGSCPGITPPEFEIELKMNRKERRKQEALKRRFNG